MHNNPQRVYKEKKIDKNKLKDFYDKLALSILEYNKGRELKEQVNQGAQSTLKQIYRDFIGKCLQGKTRNGTFRVTHNGLINEHNQFSVRTIYNHIIRLVETGFIDKCRAVCDFGKGLKGCIELKVDEALLGIEVEVRLADVKKPLPVKIQLTNTKARLNRTVRLGDLVNSLSYKV